MKIRTDVTLQFDPERAIPKVQRVFRDDLARTLWLAIKGTHIVSQHFNANMLAMAHGIKVRREIGKPITGRWIHMVLEDYGVLGTMEGAFADELALFLNNNGTITYSVAER